MTAVRPHCRALVADSHPAAAMDTTGALARHAALQPTAAPRAGGGHGEEDRDPEPERYFPNPDRPQAQPS